MKVIIRTEWPEIVRTILLERGLLFEYSGKTLLVALLSDDSYVEIAAWLGDALSCGLIARGEIER